MKLNLVQKVLISVIVLFIVTSAILSFAVAAQIRETYLSEQRRNVAEFVRKQAKQHLKATDFQTNKPTSILPRFIAYQNEIITPEIVRIKIYNTEGIVIYSDQKELIGQNLFADDPAELKEILGGNVVADIAKPDKKENAFEKQYKQLLEIYTPISFDNSGIIGIVETYYQLDLLNSEILKSQTYMITLVSAIFIILFLLLFLIVKRASRTIIQQDEQLKEDILKEKKYSSLKDEFITMSSHQLRTPASSIKWSLELLADGSLGELTAKQSEMLEGSRTNTETLISIIDNLLLVSTITPDYFTFEKIPYLLNDVVVEVLKIEEKNIKEKKLRVDVKMAEGLQKINIKKDAITTVVKNLIKNAIDYTPSEGSISINITHDNNQQLFSVEDTGIGIPDNEKEKVFDKFFRAHNSIEQKNVGSGLGLYICKTILEGYKETISFESKEKGTRFMFTVTNFSPK